jgi:thiol-disulfide isomerase/thioredoxin
MKITNGPRVLIAALLVLSLTAPGVAFGQGRQPQPPEYKEVVAATQIRDASARLKEFERIKAAYPDSRLMNAIDSSILTARIELAETLDAVLALQDGMMAGAEGPAKLQLSAVAADQILTHPKLAAFDKQAVLAAITKYKEATLAAAADPSTFEQVPQDRREYIRTRFVAGSEIFMAQAYLNAGRTAPAAESLAAYRREGGPADGPYNFVSGRVLEAEGKTKEAYEAYLAAAVDNDEVAKEKAKALYVEINGREAGFEAALESRLKALPFHPEPFQPPAGWQGKAVLAELFTGSECPPCVGADLGFDGLLESVPSKYLVVLVYHLPIPRPDPMMNPATEARQDYYGVNSTPTVVFDGADKRVGGGNRGMAEMKYKEYLGAIGPLVAAAPGAALKVQASLAGGTVKVAYEFDKAVPGADYHLVLVQGEELHRGSNGLLSHKMVVRDLLTVDPSAPRTASFDLDASEKAADAYLTEFARTYTRVPGFQWAARRNAIARTGLKVVFFAQDRETKKVLNAAVADVK